MPEQKVYFVHGPLKGQVGTVPGYRHKIPFTKVTKRRHRSKKGYYIPYLDRNFEQVKRFDGSIYYVWDGWEKKST